MAMHDSGDGSLTSMPTVEAASAPDCADPATLRAMLAQLAGEVASLRAAALVQAVLGDELREANGNLVLATLDAGTLRDAAEGAQRRQNEFLAMLAHELRNPLAPISLANAMLLRLPEPSTELLNLHAIIHRQVLHLTRLLDDLLDAARISSGKISLLRSPMPLVDLLRRSVQTVQVRLQERHQQIQLDLPEELIVDGDPVRLAQVFSNLLVNASKYTGDHGLIRVAARAHEGCAVVTVSDNGVGMDAAVLASVFDLFTQGPRALARAEGGLGVGLNVVRNIVELHGGTVAGSSDGLGLGSVFTVVLPLVADDGAVTVLPRASAVPARRRILLVEDNLDANETLGRLLLGEGHLVTSAYDGVAGLALARARAFDVLICDIGLPGLDGYQLITQLRKTAGAHIPFAIAISGYGQVEDRMRAIAAGFGQYLVKPLDADALLTLVASSAVTRFIAAARPH
ncbi:hybrid sensor histidine kinase/response regulator [Massilia antarctica]|uniref:hybrid sensor histidine kinase/response regulator n=1 Tax=Massilia antarctica TaxID=2765360 RepID=UPI0006BB8CCB|nr:hybrid sensor histidine kinase/response regulator [Massilia sp. H27-R4]MCY0910659.1 hybrid sensor histidine kinase/response regulator [Massilia sp. H27-R4]CUI08972.1 Chemotaxis protein methyltransferase CheR [Janthinobacterium sp. CG23_2]CUU32758.1 Chemotaxis protein methyltransferase CheR [Janthinobacterium sp. CG23_2]